MLKARYIAILTIVAALAPMFALAADAKTASEEKQLKLIETLKSNAPPQDKAMACKQIALCGNRDAVPVLAPLLADPQLASWARIALEVIPDSAADEALRDSLGKLNGRLLIGVINSLSVRRDARAIEKLAELLKNSDIEVASAAAAALGHIGDASAAQVLEKSLAINPPAVRSAVAEGCILCAEKLLADVKAADAARLYDVVRAADVPPQRILEATRGAILARGTAGAPLLVEQLQSADKARFAIGLRTARELPGREVAEALMTELGRASPDRQVLLILALVDRGDAAVLPAVLQVAKSGEGQARIKAIGVLKRVGNASCIPALLDSAMETNAEVAQAAMTVLSDLPGADVDADLAARLAKAEGKVQQTLIQLVGRRHIAASVPALIKAAGDPDGQLRSAALTALGFTAAFNDLPVLIERLANPESADDAVAAQKALSVACERMPNPEACSEKLVAAMAQAKPATKVKFLEVLSTLGGARALEAVAAAAKDSQPEICDAGSRLLGEWMSVDAAPVLLDLAKTSKDAKYQIRALRGYIRVARQFPIPDAQRVKMCRTALDAAERDEEKKLVLQVVERYPSPEMLTLAIELSKTPSLKNEGDRAALIIAQKLGGGAVDVRKLLANLGHSSMKIEIIKATYGAGTQVKDVTAIVRKECRDFPVIILPAPEYNSAFGGDPASGVVKQLKITYKINGKPAEVTLPENAAVVLPMPK